MCEPTTIMMGLAAASMVMSVGSALGQADYQSQVAENNAISAEYAAKDARDRGAVEEERQRNKTRALMGQQRAALAANGIDASTGTGSLLLADSAGLGEFDALTVRNNAMKQAYGLNVRADNLRAEGENASLKGQNDAFSSLLTGGSQMYGMGVKEGYWGATKAATKGTTK
jgi:hypothetical protein